MLGRVLGLVKPHKRRFYITAAMVFILAGLAAIRPKLIGYGIDEEVSAGNHRGLLIITLIVIGILVIESLLQFAQTYLANWIAQSVTLDLRSRLHDHVLGFRLRYYDRTPVGQLVTRLVSDVDGIAQVFSDGILSIIGDILKLVVIVFIMFWEAPMLTLIVLIPIPILILATRVFQRVLQAAYRQVRNQVAKINVFVQEHVTGMSVVQIFNRQEKEKEKFQAINADHRKAHIRTVWAFSIFFPVVELLSAASVSLLIWWGIGGVVRHEFTIGGILEFVLYVFMLYRPIRQLADRFTVLQEGTVNAERVFKLLDSNQKMVHAGQRLDVDFSGSIRFENVWFAYNDEAESDKEFDWVLRDLSFEVMPGETIAFVGATGAGKSSVINLLSRFYDYQKGTIMVDGTDLRDVDLNHIRQNMAVVLQDVFLFSDSIYNNVTLYDPFITLDQVKKAAEQVGASTFIEKLPGQYDFNVRERGGMLSVGQRQLLAFIRAYVYNPKILILDEATSSVDTESEELIQEAITKITKDRTSIVIAHRLSTIQNADKIIVMDKGRIVEMGNHQELLEKEGHYHRLFELQFQY